MAAGGISEALAQNGATILAAALLTILSQLPLAGLLIPIGLVLVVLFMCTSADSMSYACGHGGEPHCRNAGSNPI